MEPESAHLKIRKRLPKLDSSASSGSETKTGRGVGEAAAMDGTGRGLTGLLRVGRGVPSSSGGLTPVSYTHLDVYKRQVSRSSSASLTGSETPPAADREDPRYFASLSKWILSQISPEVTGLFTHPPEPAPSGSSRPPPPRWNGWKPTTAAPPPPMKNYLSLIHI